MNTRHREHRATEISVLFPLILLNIIIFAVSKHPDASLVASLALESAACRERHEWWRLATSMFLYQGFFHILLNMWGLWLFGGPLERAVGWWRFALLYFLAGILGGLAWVFATPAGSEQTYLGAGAGVIAVSFATATLYPNTKIMLLLPPIPMSLKVFAIAYMIFQLLLGWMDQPAALGIYAAQVCGGGIGFLYIATLSFFLPELYPVQVGLRTFWRRLAAKAAGRQAGTPDIRPFPASQVVRPPPPLPAQPPPQPPPETAIDTAEVDRLLDKIRLEGQASLTDGERQTLRQARETLRRQQGPR